MSIRSSLILSIVLLFLSGCIVDDGNLVGPCVHEFREPVLNITEVTDQNSLQSLQKVKITSIKRDLFEYNLDSEFVIYELSKIENIEHIPPLLICTLPCGFEVNDGSYVLQIDADGYRETTIDTEAVYHSGGGGCPSFSDDGTKLTFSLTPENG